MFLEDSKLHPSEVIDLLPDATFAVDLEGNVIAWNRAAEDLTGVKANEILGKNNYEHSMAFYGSRRPMLIDLVLRPAESVNKLYPVVQKEGETLTTEVFIEHLKPGGAYIWAKAMPLYDRHGELVGAIEAGRDVTQRRRFEDEIARLNEELESGIAERTAELEVANKELEAFSYSVSHDLRGPLRSIEGFSRALLEEYGERLDDTGRDYLSRVQVSAEKMGLLIGDLLKLSRVTRTEMRRETVDLSAMATEVGQELATDQPDREVEFVVRPSLTAKGDARLIRVALENLLDNAWKFTGKHPKARVEFGAAIIDGKTAYFVRDDGAGFDMKYADKLFMPFQRMHSSDDFEGTGIGLATVQRIIRRHRGRAWAESAREQGATFYFTL